MKQVKRILIVFTTEDTVKELNLYLSRCYSSAIISFSGFPEHWIAFTGFVTRSHDVLLDST